MINRDDDSESESIVTIGIFNELMVLVEPLQLNLDLEQINCNYIDMDMAYSQISQCHGDLSAQRRLVIECTLRSGTPHSG